MHRNVTDAAHSLALSVVHTAIRIRAVNYGSHSMRPIMRRKHTMCRERTVVYQYSINYAHEKLAPVHSPIITYIVHLYRRATLSPRFELDDLFSRRVASRRRACVAQHICAVIKFICTDAGERERGDFPSRRWMVTERYTYQRKCTLLSISYTFDRYRRRVR